MVKPDTRSTEAQAYRRWYKLARWCGKHGRRAQQLQAEPLCAICLKEGRITAATVADHIEPHRGDYRKFWFGKLQSLCDADPWRCHSRVKQQEEAGGKPIASIGLDGWPLT